MFRVIENIGGCEVNGEIPRPGVCIDGLTGMDSAGIKVPLIGLGVVVLGSHFLPFWINLRWQER
ncbi:hypothetical protein O7746_09185 [Corynebacterium pseudotuberculosis]|uniref:hypothetical protein n=1 Tax=Corynebacterium pseudotuberculosis TaxID=1719 RepID=UPI0024175735|nr:hypothetical protein [Corynebacterium pseudotuberculosis]WFP67654.1 hypothetical protein P8128_02480 [Corynebacterium pseudotuberculosis]